MSIERWAICDVCGKTERHEVAAFTFYPDVPDGWFSVSLVPRGNGAGDYATVCTRVCAVAAVDRVAKKWGITAEQLETDEAAR